MNAAKSFPKLVTLARIAEPRWGENDLTAIHETTGGGIVLSMTMTTMSLTKTPRTRPTKQRMAVTAAMEATAVTEVMAATEVTAEAMEAATVEIETTPVNAAT